MQCTLIHHRLGIPMGSILEMEEAPSRADYKDPTLMVVSTERTTTQTRMTTMMRMMPQQPS
jgi:hypothetical protein